MSRSKYRITLIGADQRDTTDRSYTNAAPHSIDYKQSKDVIMHHAINGAGRYRLENVANLDQPPPQGFFVFVVPVKIRTASGGPVRIMAVLPPMA